jgi:histidine ammonia-lyase
VDSSNRSPTLVVCSEVRERIQRYRDIVAAKSAGDGVYYGINTGFGLLSDVKISKKDIRQLQLNIVRSHACGVGPSISELEAAALLILRAHTIALGHHGLRPEVVDLLCEMIKCKVLPSIPSQGSVGASGDLAPLAHIAWSLIGEGTVFFKGEKRPTLEVFNECGIHRLELLEKEGLSLINGTQFSSALGAVTLEKLKQLIYAADLALAISLDAIRGTTRAFDIRLHKLKAHKGQLQVALNVIHLLGGEDQIQNSHATCGRVQDPYSFRCSPQVHGACRDTYDHVSSVFEIELNSVTDNPIIFENGDIVSGGNFHAQSVAMAMDFAAVAACELASISEQRVMKLTNPVMNGGLPAFLINDSGLNSGFMIPHVVCASLVSENKTLAHPASVDSIPTSADKEDHVSMAPWAQRKLAMIVANTSKVLAIELIAAAQGIDLLRPLKASPHVEAIHKKIREMSEFMAQDRAIGDDIEKVSEWILGCDFLKFASSLGLDVEADSSKQAASPKAK